MPGPNPKPSAARKRRNVKSTATTLVADPDAQVPDLPAPPLSQDRGLPAAWEPMAVAFWNDLWMSPMATQWTEADGHGLHQLLCLVHLFHRSDDPETKRKLHAEIRTARRDYGLTPMSRASLHWTIAEAERAHVRAVRERPQRPMDAEAELAALGP